MFDRQLKKGSIELIILALLKEQRRHGYEVGKLIESRSGGNLTFRLHTLYPTLSRMEERGVISSRWVEEPGQRRRRYYRLTKAGRKALEKRKANWLEYAAAVNRIIGVENA